MTEILVLKLDLDRHETWRYTGKVLRCGSKFVLLEAYFNRDDLDFHGIHLGRGDRFIEKFYADRWYNIFEIHDRNDDRLKGWYCNVCLPAELQKDQVAYVDLALDLLVFPDGRQLVLDEDEFAVLSLDKETQQEAQRALNELQRLFASQEAFQLENA